nr:MAG TPA: hypothetical protein [Caudoviricetes sp.]
MSVEYIVYHLNEYAANTRETRDILQGYLDQAWNLVEEVQATKDEAFHIRDLARLVSMIFDSDNEIVFKEVNKNEENK